MTLETADGAVDHAPRASWENLRGPSRTLAACVAATRPKSLTAAVIPFAVGTSLETDTQQHPSDTLCFAYNKAVDVVYGVAHACSFAAGSYYGGACACEPIPVVL